MSDFKAKMHQMSAGALPQSPLGELTALPNTPSWILGSLLLSEKRAEEGRGGEGNGKGGEGTPCSPVSPPATTF